MRQVYPVVVDPGPLIGLIGLALPHLAPVVRHRPIPDPVLTADPSPFKSGLHRMAFGAKGLQSVDPESIGPDSPPGPNVIDHIGGPD